MMKIIQENGMSIGGKYREMYFKLLSFCKCDFKGQPQRSKEENESFQREEAAQRKVRLFEIKFMV